MAQCYFARGVDTELLVGLYSYWRDLDERIVLQKSWWEKYVLKHSYLAVKCSKRGNDVYRWRVKQRLGWMDKIPNAEFFKDSDVAKGVASTRMVFFTLTYDTKLCSRTEAWERVGEEYDDWVRGIRSKYGKVSIFRVWQAFANGYPHIHGMVLFREKSFKIDFIQQDEVNGHVYSTYRVAEKADFQCGWHSWVDVCGVKTVKGALKYAKRYSSRKQESSPNQTQLSDYKAKSMQYGGCSSDLDLALMWLFRKRGFAVSGDFREALSDLIRRMHNSERKGMEQSCLDGSMLGEAEFSYSFVGVFSLGELGIRVKDPGWVEFLEELPSGIESLVARWRND
jgi:hypothetical protein